MSLHPSHNPLSCTFEPQAPVSSIGPDWRSPAERRWAGVLGEGWSASRLHQVEDCHQELWSEPSTVCASSQLPLAELSASVSPAKMVFETALQTEDERSSSLSLRKSFHSSWPIEETFPFLLAKARFWTL